jgi:hypothetical protein
MVRSWSRSFFFESCCAGEVESGERATGVSRDSHGRFDMIPPQLKSSSAATGTLVNPRNTNAAVVDQDLVMQYVFSVKGTLPAAGCSPQGVTEARLVDRRAAAVYFTSGKKEEVQG